MREDQSTIWVWFSGMHRCERAHWSDEAARAEVNSLAEDMNIGRINWSQVDDRTWVGSTAPEATPFVVVVTSVLLPHTPP
jgi:hypothetical protein